MSYGGSDNIPPVNEPDKKRVIGGWATEDQRRVIDVACALLGKKRAHFLVETAFERALQIVGKAA